MPKKKSIKFENPAIDRIRNTRGLARRLGEQLKLTRTAVWMWKDEVPAKHAVKVARALDIPVHLVCPSIFPPPGKERKLRASTEN